MRPPITTDALGEEGPIVTSHSLGEEGPTTDALGEEGPIIVTTLVVGEEDGGTVVASDSPFGAF